MLCLRCKVEMNKTIFDGVLVDYCPECKGFWLDAGEFELALREEPADVQELWKKAKEEKRRKSIVCPQDNICPSCLVGKIKEITRDDVEVDECDSCHGIFFDKGELEKCHNNEKKWYIKIMQHVRDLF